MTNNTLAQTPLHGWHATHHGRMVEFAGYSMPVQYRSIVAEHTAVRTSLGLFDISHMGRLRFDGAGAERFLDSLVTRRIAGMKPGRVAYSLVTDESGGILDDVLVYRMEDAAGGTYYLMVVNAGNREKIVRWIDGHLTSDDDVQFSDVTDTWAMIAVQGPRALEVTAPLVDADLAGMKYYVGCETLVVGRGGLISRTGYTGEDGFELIVGAGAVEEIWDALIEAATPLGGLPAGLGCRDTLRLEAGMPLYGHELSEQVDPFQAGLGFAVDLKKGPFPGRDALVERKNASDAPRRVGLLLTGNRIPREGYTILAFGDAIGQVTSGTFSPTLEKPIAMGYVQRERADVGNRVDVDIRGRAAPATIVELPFYRRKTGR